MTSKGEREFLMLLGKIVERLEAIESKLETKEAPKKKKILETKE